MNKVHPFFFCGSHDWNEANGRSIELHLWTETLMDLLDKFT